MRQSRKGGSRGRHELLSVGVDEEKLTSRDRIRAQIAAIRKLGADERASLVSLFGNRVPAVGRTPDSHAHHECA